MDRIFDSWFDSLPEPPQNWHQIFTAGYAAGLLRAAQPPVPADATRDAKAYDVATMKDWRCFHCDEVFHTEMEARNHFGSTEVSEPACLIKAPGEFALLQALRNAEAELSRYRREDSDILRAMWSMQADHATALRREEEKGYARGLEDAKAHPETLGLQRAAQETRTVPEDRWIKHEQETEGGQ